LLRRTSQSGSPLRPLPPLSSSLPLLLPSSSLLPPSSSLLPPPLSLSLPSRPEAVVPSRRACRRRRRVRCRVPLLRTTGAVAPLRCSSNSTSADAARRTCCGRCSAAAAAAAAWAWAKACCVAACDCSSQLPARCGSTEGCVGVPPPP
jgi:hypothetical protein